MAQVYVGCKTHSYHTYPMHQEKEFLHTIQDWVNEHGAPTRLFTDNAQAKTCDKVQAGLQLMMTGQWFSEAFKQFQNHMECGI